MVMNPHQWSFAKLKCFKRKKNVDQKVPKEAEAIRDGVINPQIYYFNQFYTDNFDALNVLRIDRM